MSTINKRRKGFIMATCFVSLLLVSFMTTSILTSVTVQQASLKLEKTVAYTHYKLQQIGDDFLNGDVRNGDVIDGFTCQVDRDNVTVGYGTIWGSFVVPTTKNCSCLTVKNSDANTVMKVAVVDNPYDSDNGKVVIWQTSGVDGVLER